jgi:hypothetical protein
MKKTTRPRKPRQIGNTSLHVRVPARQLALLKEWIGKQPEPKPSPTQALLRLAGIALEREAAEGGR